MTLICPVLEWPIQSQACRPLVCRLAQSTTVSEASELYRQEARLTPLTVGNEQELNRDTISSNIDDRTTHEVSCH